MRIIIDGRAIALDSTTKQEITQPEELKKLDGVVYTEDSCCEYLTSELDEIGLTGGLLRLAYLAEKNQLRVITDYQSPRELKPKELKALVKETRAQWSDGIGESYYWQQVHPGVAVDLSPLVQEQDLHTEQIDDGIKPSRKRFSPLLKAAEVGDLDKINKLLAKGEEINVRDKRGRPALQIAIWKQHFNAALFLIERGADVNAREISKQDLTEQAPLHVACRLAVTSLGLVQALLQKNADVNATDSRGWTPLMWAGRVVMSKLSNS
jgi:hypothetical protein